MMQRYGIVERGDGSGDLFQEVRKMDDGDMVLYSDAKAIEEERDDNYKLLENRREKVADLQGMIIDLQVALAAASKQEVGGFGASLEMCGVSEEIKKEIGIDESSNVQVAFMRMADALAAAQEELSEARREIERLKIRSTPNPPASVMSILTGGCQ